MIRTSSCREDGSTVLIGYTNHLRLEVGMQTDLIADGCGQQIAW